MRILSLLGGEEIAASTFKQVEGGWVFKTPPFRKLTGLSPYYRISNAQKADITTLYVRLWRLSMLGLIPLIIAVVVLAKTVPALSSGYDLVMSAVFGLMLGIGVLIAYTSALRTRLRDAPPVTDRISWADQQMSMIDHMPLWRIVVFGTCSVLLLALSIFGWPMNSLPFVHKLVSLVLFGFATLYFAFAMAAKIRRARGAS